MKEAAGEANMTVITIVLIGVVAAVGLVLVPRLMSNIKAKACCTDAGGIVSGNSCFLRGKTNFADTGADVYKLTGSNFKTQPETSACMAE